MPTNDTSEVARGEARAVQHAAWVGARARLGIVTTPPRVRRPPPLIERPQPVYERRQPRKPLLTPPVKPHGPPDGEQWPAQPRPVFYDDAAPDPVAGWQDVLNNVCITYDVTLEELLGPRHFANLAKARAEACFRMAVDLQMSQAGIGRRMNRDPTSVVAAINRYTRVTPGAASKLRAVRAALRRDRQALKERAVHLYLHEGKSVSQIADLLPMSDQTIRTAIKKWSEWQ